METGDAAEWLRHAESDLAYSKLGQGQQAILRNQAVIQCRQQQMQQQKTRQL